MRIFRIFRSIPEETIICLGIKVRGCGEDFQDFQEYSIGDKLLLSRVGD